MELWCCLQTQFATSFNLSCFIDGSAGIKTFIFLLIRDDGQGVVTAIGAHLVLAALDKFLAKTVPFDVR